MITIRHTHADGTLVEGSAKGDGVYEIVKQHGFRYFPSIKAIGIRGSRDRIAGRRRINAAAEALRTAGHEVTVEIDDNPRDRAQVLADQAERLDDRRDALEAKAEKRSAEAQALWDYSDRLVEHIPPGQPILVGHHSERGHRRTLERSQNAAFKALALGKAAKETARRADAVGSAAAYSATPAVTARRIETAEADLRRIQKKLDGYTRRSLNGRGQVVYVDEHPPADGEWREQLLARKAQLEQQRDYDRAALAAAQAAGQHQGYGPHNVHVGDRVRYSIGWQEVVKVNRVTVSLKTPYSWTDKIRFTELREVRCDHKQDGAA